MLGVGGRRRRQRWMNEYICLFFILIESDLGKQEKESRRKVNRRRIGLRMASEISMCLRLASSVVVRFAFPFSLLLHLFAFNDKFCLFSIDP